MTTKQRVCLEVNVLKFISVELSLEIQKFIEVWCVYLLFWRFSVIKMESMFVSSQFLHLYKYQFFMYYTNGFDILTWYKRNCCINQSLIGIAVDYLTLSYCSICFLWQMAIEGAQIKDRNNWCSSSNEVW